LNYKNILFDLDGTLTDPGLGIKNSIRYSLNKFGLPIPPESVLNEFIGPPLVDSYQKHCGADENDARTLLGLYREYFGTKGYLENELFYDTADVLRKLKERGYGIYLATSKPEHYALKILEHFDILKYFDFCAGNDMAETRAKKADVIGYLIEQTGISPAQSLMVGDRRYDVEGAAVHSIATAAVLNGYGSREELKSAAYLIKDLSGIFDILVD